MEGEARDDAPAPAPATVRVGELGSGPPVLLLRGWPTSSYLWRNVTPPIADRNRVIAPDLPGFGESSKPTDASYSFPFFERAIDGLPSLELPVRVGYGSAARAPVVDDRAPRSGAQGPPGRLLEGIR